ncbi:Dyp-type peroxidase [Halomonas heilongjiangensis]|uniref:Peroxidase n=1 Tax=Halomonas heilongjiangensis TaxID=1387883 RepID=A0A2N7TJE3_9GAMM|nr:peroxidase [Halomonas heilongjiangensis]PMR68302.1 peroxidase [Halomonas heilongjiangensis]PXX93152.1 peroxidase [Halomonas heilongjiangensis]
MTVSLELHDIQGNVVKGYGRQHFSFARYILFAIHDERAGRKFIRNILPLITTATPWKTCDNDSGGVPKPEATTNIAFTYHGLKCLGLPESSLHSFPTDFSDGMRARRDILGDHGKSAPENWDPVWNHPDKKVAILVSINGQSTVAIENRYKEIQKILEGVKSGMEQLCGHRGESGAEDLPYQEASAIFNEQGDPTPKEHFGYTDGISNPFFKGTGKNPNLVIGSGKPSRDNPEGWAPIEPGEFLLGYRDESQETPKAPTPPLLAKNGTFMVYRKLHQNVNSFDTYLSNQSTKHPEFNEEEIAAKFAGRWRNGAPITRFPTEEEADNFVKSVKETKKALDNAKDAIELEEAELLYSVLLSQYSAFNYDEDLDGSRCPVGAHIRRCNPRGSLEYGTKAYATPGALTNRRRLLRRGLPYGDSSDRSRDDGNHGIIFMTLGASISRQFEFVQQQWINYGNDFKAANEKDPLLGNHGVDKLGRGNGKMLFQKNKGSDESPYFCSHIPRFVDMHGGEYFFLPSITALHFIGRGTVDGT